MLVLHKKRIGLSVEKKSKIHQSIRMNNKPMVKTLKIKDLRSLYPMSNPKLEFKIPPSKIDDEAPTFTRPVEVFKQPSASLTDHGLKQERATSGIGSCPYY